MNSVLRPTKSMYVLSEISYCLVDASTSSIIAIAPIARYRFTDGLFGKLNSATMTLFRKGELFMCNLRQGVR